MIKPIVALISIVILVEIIFLSKVNLLAAESLQLEGKIVFTISKIEKNIDHIYVFDGTTQRITQLTKKGRNFWPEWSPDGGKIVFSSIRNGHNDFEIYIMDADGKNQKRLTYTGKNSEPRWSGRGEIYFQSGFNEGVATIKDKLAINKAKIQIRLIRSVGNYIEELIKEDAKNKERVRRLQEWLNKRQEGIFYIYPSLDGEKDMVYYNSGLKMILVDRLTGAHEELKSKHAGRPAWSRDSKRIAYVDGDMGDFFMIFDVEKNEYQKITLNKNPDFGCGGKLSWSRDSNRLVYSCGHIDYTKDESWLYILDLETKKTTQLIKGSSPDWY